jgi:hypothetical protein
MRAASRFSTPHHKAAAVVLTTQASGRMYYDGQMDGLKKHIPVQLGSAPKEEHDDELREFYLALLTYSDSINSEVDSWHELICRSILTKRQSKQILSWAWRADGKNYLAIINYSSKKASGFVRVPWLEPSKCEVVFGSNLKSGAFKSNAGEAKLKFNPWDYMILSQKI